MLLGIAMICFGNSLALLNMFGTSGITQAIGMILSAVGIVVFIFSFFRKSK